MISVGLIAVTKDEPKILEWVAYHFCLGFQKIYLIDNACDLSLKRRLSFLSPKVVWIPDSTDWSKDGDIHQKVLLKHFRSLVEPDGSIEWLLSIDTDEYLSSPLGKDTLSLIEEIPSGVDQVLINWHHFGSPGTCTSMGFDMMIEDIVASSLPTWECNFRVKPLVRVKSVLDIKSTHFFKVLRKSTQNIGGPVVSPGITLEQVIIYPWKINHYKCRGMDYWRWRVGVRGNQPHKGNPRLSDWGKHAEACVYPCYQIISDSDLIQQAKDLKDELSIL